LIYSSSGFDIIRPKKDTALSILKKKAVEYVKPIINLIILLCLT